jgi:hypothetical protein
MLAPPKIRGKNLVAHFFDWQVAEKLWMQAAQKDLRGEAREESMSAGVRSQYVVARRSSAT